MGAGSSPRNVERLAGYLTTRLVADGHDVTVLTSLDGLMAGYGKFDIIHLHGNIRCLSVLHDIATPIVATLHSYPNPSTIAARAMLPSLSLVALTEHQRTLFKGLRWQDAILPGLPERVHPLHIDSGSYLAYVGSVKAMTALRRAVEVALCSGLPLRIGNRIPGRELRQLDRQLAPFIARGVSVEFVCELEAVLLGDFLGRARALLVTDEWCDPLPLAMLDSLACGTPLVAWRSGASETVLRDGEAGSLVTSVEEAAEAVARLHEINRLSCRRVFDERFGIKRMSQQYVCLYELLMQSECRALMSESRAFHPPAELGRDGVV